MNGWRTRSFLPVRPVGAFALITLGLVGVGAKVVATQELGAEGREKRAPIRLSALDYAEPPLYELVDRDGVEIARSVRGQALEASPFHLWLVHTPERILGGLRAVLGDEAPDELERRLLGTDEDGWCTVAEWRLTPDEARDVVAWVESGGPSNQPGVGPLPGVDLAPIVPEGDDESTRAAASGPMFRLRWRPAELLAEATRQRLDPNLLDDKHVSASAWTRALSEDLYDLLGGARERHLAELANAGSPPPEDFEEVPPPSGLGKLLEGVIEAPPSWRVSAAVPGWQLATSKREWVMSGLVPARHAKICALLPVELVDGVRAFLAEEHVGGYQIWLRPTSERTYPAGRFAVLGRIGWQEDDPKQRHGLWGVERAAEVALARIGDGVDRPGGRDRFERDVLVRARADGQEYYRDHGTGGAPPRVVTTLDTRLQTRVARVLEDIEREHGTSLGMAIVVDLDTRDVLALDWRDPYEFGLFMPVQHQYTPGSTFKIVTMGLALDLGRVTPDQVFDVGYGRFNVPGTSRWVGEAEGFATGRITAAECLARSSNAGMIQIGLGVTPEEWRERTRELGYGVPIATDLLGPNMANPAGIIGERAASKYDKPWARHRSHASVCFGDSMSLNFLQHTTALCALVHDGELRPLRFVEAACTDAGIYELPPSEGPRVVRPSTCRTLVEMMRLGAEAGTGKTLERPDELVLATKTGTYEKLAGDVDHHLLGRDLAAARRAGEEWDGGDAHRRLRGQWGERGKAHTSSIVVVGWLEGTDHRVLVHVLADDPQGSEHFGSRVTGSGAVELVASALGIDEASHRLEVLAIDGAPRVVGVDVPELGDLPERPWEADFDASEYDELEYDAAPYVHDEEAR
ncbi:MAG: penicillin-binding transpeptidase domain-containing protein [Planctomycetota bacterium]